MSYAHIYHAKFTTSFAALSASDTLFNQTSSIRAKLSLKICSWHYFLKTAIRSPKSRDTPLLYTSSLRVLGPLQDSSQHYYQQPVSRSLGSCHSCIRFATRQITSVIPVTCYNSRVLVEWNEILVKTSVVDLVEPRSMSPAIRLQTSYTYGFCTGT